MLVIYCALLTVFYDLRTNGQDVCCGNQTNYTKQEYKEVSDDVNETTSVWTISTDHCNLLEEVLDYLAFWWPDKCEPKPVERFQTKTVPRLTVESYNVIRCCPGYNNVSNVCIQGCPAGTYGQENCTQNCSYCRSYCNKTTGACICDDGFTGENCTEACEPGFYGSDCLYNCMCSDHGTCNGTDGSCNCTEPGWRGTHCNEECMDGAYGLHCTDNCTCNINQKCNTVNGSCTCKPGWKGENCSQVCESNMFGVDCMEVCTCNSTYTEYCDKVTGYCMCMPGYIGQNCSHECPLGMYGHNCSMSCSVRCTDRNTNYCHHINGTCICLGKQGYNCTDDCDVGKYGPDCAWPCNCSATMRNKSCDNITGQCSCMEGWTGRRCDQECMEDTYGLHCTDNCTCNMNQTCNTVNGSCTCKPGWKGENCSQVCESNMFGVDCMGVCTCNSTYTEYCDKVTGYCMCMPGYIGQNCSHDVDTTGSSSRLGLIEKKIVYLVSAGAGMFIVSIAVIFTVCSCRRSTHTRKKILGAVVVNSQDNQSYELGGNHNIKLEQLNTYEDTRIDDENQTKVPNSGTIETSADTAEKDACAGCSEPITNRHSAEEDYYSSPDVLTSKESKPETEHPDMDTLGGSTGKATGKMILEYADTTEDIVIDETAPNEYDTFEAVRKKLQEAACNKEHETEEDYDVISHKKSQKTGQEEGYSSFEQVRKLSLRVKNKYADEDIVMDETAPNEYNTFEDVRKLQEAACNKEHETEEDYDVISHKNSQKTGQEERYSSFEQVRKLSLQGQNNDDDVYNLLHKNMPLSKSAVLNHDTYHHIRLENKTCNGETPDISKTKTQRQNSSDKELPRQNPFTNTTNIIIEETEEDMHIDDIYDECSPIEDTLEIAHSEHKSREDIENKLQEIKSVANEEAVYEECDMTVDEKPRPTSPVNYEYVNNEDSNNKINKDVGIENNVSGENEESRRLPAKRSQRRREDYEVFEL